MKPNDTTLTPPSAIPAKDKDDAFKLSFWISQFFILIATVLGVYLASSQGFKQAIAYGEIQSDKSNYYLRKSLQGELADNLLLVRKYMKKIETGGIGARKEPFALETFVWDAMKFSPATLETPSELLQESRAFYRNFSEIQDKVASSSYSGPEGARRLQDLIDHMEKTVLPKFQSDLDSLNSSLNTRGITP